jgi:hypothetical protein
LYRGLGNLSDLPDSFHHPNQHGIRGFAEQGFMSTTSDREVAMGYSQGLVMELVSTAVDRGACVVELSQ